MIPDDPLYRSSFDEESEALDEFIAKKRHDILIIGLWVACGLLAGVFFIALKLAGVL